MKILSANVNGRVKAAAHRQLEAILARDPDVIALQEVTLGSYRGWCDALNGAGYSVLSTIDLLPVPYPEPPYPSPPFPRDWKEPHDQIKRKNFNVLASRYPIAQLPGLSFSRAEEARYAFPEKHVSARISLDVVEVVVHNAHVTPGASRGVLKVHHFEAIRRRVDEDSASRRVLCGDFNAPLSEDENGPVIGPGWGWPQDILERWNRAEREAIANPDLRDAYRDVHDRSQPWPASHVTGSGERQTPHRYDFIFASSGLRTEDCRYLTDWLIADRRHGRLSDHAPVEAVLALVG